LRVIFATTPTPAPRKEAAVVPIESTLGPKPTAAAAVTPVIPAPATVTATGTAPPAAMLCAVANKLPATTFPIPACIPAAALPDSVALVSSMVYVSGGSTSGGGLGIGLPATVPVALKPSMLRPAGARIGVKTMPTAAAPTPTAIGSTSKGVPQGLKHNRDAFFEHRLDIAAYIQSPA
jgi:hypothetical protein